MIPKVVHYTFATNKFPFEILANIEHNKTLCPEYEFIFYDNDACDAFIKSNFNEKIYLAYKKINPEYGAMRADFFRYCVLFMKGGVYIDVKSSFKYNLSQIIKETDTCLLDVPRALESWRKSAPTFEQWVLIFVPNHPYLRTMINLMTDYITREFIPEFKNKLLRMTAKEMVLNITGPDAFTRAVLGTIQTTKMIMHRTINYMQYFTYCSVPDYKSMYVINSLKHYSDGSAPIYLKL